MVGKIVNHVPKLLAKKGLRVQDLQYGMNVPFDTAADWAEHERLDGTKRPAPKQVSAEIMAKLCNFFGVQPGDIWEFVPDKKK